MKLIVILYSLPPSPNGCKSKDHYSSESWNIMDDWGYGSWGMDRIARWGMDRGMDRGVWIACGPGPLIHTLHFDLHPYRQIDSPALQHTPTTFRSISVLALPSMIHNHQSHL